MEPDVLFPILLALPAPILLALAVVVAARWRGWTVDAGTLAGGGEGGAARVLLPVPLWPAGLALGGAMVAGGLIRIGPGQLLGLPSYTTWPVAAAVLALTFTALERRWEGVRGLVWILRALLLVGLTFALARPRMVSWTTPEAAAWLAGFPLLMLASWWGLDRAARRAGPTGPLMMWALAALTSVARIATGSIKGAEAGAWLACGCGALLLVTALLPRRVVPMAGPGAGVFAVTIGTLWFIGPNGADMAVWQMVLLALCPVAGLLADIGPLGRLTGWTHAIVRTALAAVPAAAVLAVALPQAAKDAAGTTSGGAATDPYVMP